MYSCFIAKNFSLSLGYFHNLRYCLEDYSLYCCI